MGQRTDISSIAFDIIYPIDDSQPYLERVSKSAVNWSYTNWKGMTFGILFGATLLTLMRSLPIWRLPRSGFLAALQGLIGGAPLGVCVNCATPIAQGLHRAGIRLETMLAVLTSSPTLNLIVITMMLSLFSWYFVIIKLGVTLFFIAVLIPAIVWLWSKYSSADISQLTVPEIKNPLSHSNDGVSDGWISSIKTSVVEMLENLFFLLKITLPLMLLAGFLGAMLIETISLDTMANLSSGLSSYFLIALLGVFLPVPMAFDVVFTSALISIGLPPGLAMTLFFSLSIFSIFPALVIGRDISWKLSSIMASAVVIVAILSGLLTEHVHGQIVEIEQQQIDEALQELGTDAREAKELNNSQPESPPIFQHAIVEKVRTAKTLCGNTFATEGECLSNLLRNRAFGSVDSGLCSAVGSAIKESDPTFADLCNQILESKEASKLAIRTVDISQCNGYECRMTYLNATSYIDGAVSRCDSIVPEARVPLCRKLVLFNRIMQNRTDIPCSDDLLPGEMAFCQSQVKARDATDQLDLETCIALTDPEASYGCYSTVLAIKISNSRGQFSCTGLHNRNYTKICEDLLKERQAISRLEIGECKKLESSRVQSCQLDIIQLLVQSSGEEALATLSLPEPSFDEEAHITSFSLPETVRYELLQVFDNVSISTHPATLRSPPTNKFELQPGDEIGITHAWSVNATDLNDPFNYGKGISAGDINNDGYPDVIVAFERGVYVYANLGTGKFALSSTLVPAIDFNTFVAALVDFNNDGFLDIFLSAYGGKQFFYISDAGDFTRQPPVAVPTSTSTLTMAAGFADLDQDADLDIVLGKWAYGLERRFQTHNANNEVWLNESGVFKQLPLFDPDPPGPTLSILLSDLNEDSVIDIVTGNDRQTPDIFHFSQGPLEYLPPSPGTIPETSLNTMSYDSADFNNDLKLDLFSSDMTFSQPGRDNYCDAIPEGKGKGRCLQLVETGREVGDYNIKWCNTKPKAERIECLAATILAIAIRENNANLCDKIPQGFIAKRQYCTNVTGDIPPDEDIDLKKYPAQRATNKYLMAQGAKFIDVSENAGIARSNWSWNSKALDIDNDRFQDILVGTGFGFGSSGEADLLVNLEVFPNVVFHNMQGLKFVRAEGDFGLDDYINTSAYALTDFDLDGDMDILEYGQLVGIRLYENRVNRNNSVTFLFDDQRGNRFCIGCKITIESESGEQIREIKASGGYLSFDEPIAQFGLGGDMEITDVKVQWSTGEVTKLDRKLNANRRYLISRH